MAKNEIKVKKQFRVELNTKGSYSVEILPIDTEEYDVDEMTLEDAEELLDGYESEYIAYGALGDEWEGYFELKVYNENDEVVFESDDFSDFRFVNDFMQEDEEFTSNADLQNAAKEWEKRWEENAQNSPSPGTYLTVRHENKWIYFKFNIEDDAFDPSKLFFIANNELQGLVYDYMTDPNHIFYDNKFVDAEDDTECCEEYGRVFVIMEKDEDGWWNEINELEE